MLAEIDSGARGNGAPACMRACPGYLGRLSAPRPLAIGTPGRVHVLMNWTKKIDALEPTDRSAKNKKEKRASYRVHVPVCPFFVSELMSEAFCRSSRTDKCVLVVIIVASVCSPTMYLLFYTQ